jgi:beta-galactosidase
VHVNPWGVFVTTPKISTSGSSASVTTQLANDSATPVKVMLRTTVLEAGGKQVTQVESPLQMPAGETLSVKQVLSLPTARLWLLEDPYLYTLTSEVLADGQVLDAETTTFGIRSISIGETSKWFFGSKVRCLEKQRERYAIIAAARSNQIDCGNA